jgi:hypothetical protein
LKRRLADELSRVVTVAQANGTSPYASKEEEAAERQRPRTLAASSPVLLS